MGELIGFSKDDPDEKYVKAGILGEGSYGAVFKVLDDDKMVYAMKVLKIEEDYSKEDILKEISILANCKDDFLVGFYEYMEKEDKLYVVMELCDCGSVNDLMQICNLHFDENTLKDIIGSCLLGLYAMHRRHIIHRDIKAGNLLLTRKGQVKLGDFGVSAELRRKGDKRKSVIGTPFWMAPEIVMEHPYGPKVDIWSMGITLIELADQEPPNSHMHPMRALLQIPLRPPPRFKRPAKWSDEMNDFLEKCLRKKPDERHSAEDLLEHPFVASSIINLSDAEPRGSSNILRVLVDKYLPDIERFRAKEEDRAKRRQSASTVSDSDGGTAIFVPDGSGTVSSVESGDSGNTPMFLPTDNAAGDGVLNLPQAVLPKNKRPVSVMDTSALRSFLRDETTSPLSTSVFFNLDASKEHEGDDEEIKTKTLLKPSKEERQLLIEMRNKLRAIDKKYKQQVKVLKESYVQKRKVLANQAQWK